MSLNRTCGVREGYEIGCNNFITLSLNLSSAVPYLLLRLRSLLPDLHRVP